MIVESLAVIGFALLLDFKFGDPSNRYHPTAWIGFFIARLVPVVKNRMAALEKLGGICIVLVTSGLVLLLLLSVIYLGIPLLGMVVVSGITAVIPTVNATDYVTLLVSIIIGGALLKSTVAIRGMERHALSVLASLDKTGLDVARNSLSMIVKRNTKNLDKSHIISGTLESVSESTVDGITAPLFYYAFFGLPGAFVYRVINTADSMIGYKSDIFRNVGWFAATCDSVVNYIPARLTGLVMVVSALVLRYNWKDSYRIMVRDGGKTASPNAGYPMAALAGALQTKFEKIGHYTLGDGSTIPAKEHVYAAITIMKLTSVLFVGMVTVPVILVLSAIGWWIHA